MANNGDTDRLFKVGPDFVRGIGSFHKTLPRSTDNPFGEVDEGAFETLVSATRGEASFQAVPAGGAGLTSGTFTNPEAGLAHDRLTRHPASYDMPPAPSVLSVTAAAEMTELYWMSLLRDVSLDAFEADGMVADAAAELSERFVQVSDDDDPGHFIPGVDLPGSADELSEITPQNIFRMGLPGEERGPYVSQFFVRSIGFGTQTIDPMQLPYASGQNYLTGVDEWRDAQATGYGPDGKDYRQSNEASSAYYEPAANRRYVSTLRDLARFVNKDALHQAYFNAALLMLAGGASWTSGNPYANDHEPPAERLAPREAGFGTLGGPHILALVSEVATRALKIVWNQKWQVNLRLRPESYAGLVHFKRIGIGGVRRPYKLPGWVTSTEAVKAVRKMNKDVNGDDTMLLPMAFTAGSPTHPAYGAGHAAVAGACVTVLKAYFKLYDRDAGGAIFPRSITTLKERAAPFDAPTDFATFVTGIDGTGLGHRTTVAHDGMTIEGELNKLASNVAMGRSIGGVHWRTDNTRSLSLGEAIAAHILADIAVDVNEKPTFEFRTFARRADGQPKVVRISQGRVYVDDVLVDAGASAL